MCEGAAASGLRALHLERQRVFEDLREGVRVVKHPRKGSPRAIVLYLTGNEGATGVKGLMLKWSTSWFRRGELPVCEITEVLAGGKTLTLKRTGVKGCEGTYLSLITRRRTLDLECSTTALRDRLVRTFKTWLLEAGDAAGDDFAALANHPCFQDIQAVKERAEKFSEEVNIG
ncbi:unnamed protein product [Chrysoparadoxa australica]